LRLESYDSDSLLVLSSLSYIMFPSKFYMCSPLLCPGSLSYANGVIFDYVIVGGGTAGAVLANRLSENESVSVAVIEAGGSALDDPLARTIYGDCPPCNTGLDWNYSTVPQRYLNDNVKPYHAGRCLGGTSVLNGKLVSDTY
jgi:hypothetical protein